MTPELKQVIIKTVKATKTAITLAVELADGIQTTTINYRNDRVSYKSYRLEVINATGMSGHYRFNTKAEVMKKLEEVL